MAAQHSPNGPLTHQQHYPPPFHQQPPGPPPPNGVMHPQQQQQVKSATAQRLANANEEVWMAIGQVSEALGDFDGASHAYERAMVHNQWSVRAMLAISCILRAKEQFTAAVEYLRNILKIESQNGDVWSSLGHCYLMMDDLQQAYSAYQQALYHLPDPKEPKLWYGIGILYDRYGSLDHAEEAFSQVMRMQPNFEKANEVYFRLGIIYKQQQKFQSSLECFRYIVTDPPRPLSEEDIWFQIGHVHEQQKDYDSAKSAYTRVLERDPSHAKVLQQLGWLHHQQSTSFSSQEQAIEYLEKSVNSDQTDAQSWYLLGRCYMSQQKYPKAYEAYQQAVYRDGRNPTFWCSIGVLYYQINQYRDALDAYSRAIRLNPNISEVWYDLGTLYESCNNQTGDAIDAYNRAAELDPTNVHIKARLALLNGQPTNGLPNQAGAPLPQDVHPQAYQQPGALGAPAVPQWPGHNNHNPPTGPAPPPLAAGNNWGSNRLAEMQSAQPMQVQPVNHYDQRDRAPPGGPMQQPSPPRHDQARQYQPEQPPARQAPAHRGLSRSPKVQSSGPPAYPHAPQHQSHPSLPHHSVPPPQDAHRSAYGAPSSHMHTSSGTPQNALAPYVRPAEPSMEGRPPHQSVTSPRGMQYSRSHADPHPGSATHAGHSRPASTAPPATAADIGAREREERASSTVPVKRLREWEDDSSSSSKKLSTDESRSRLDEIKTQRASPGEKLSTPPRPSPGELRRGEEPRPPSAYRPSEAAHHPPTLPSVMAITQPSPAPPSSLPPQEEAARAPSVPQPAPAFEPAARKMEVDENYDDSGDDKPATKQESQKSSPKPVAVAAAPSDAAATSTPVPAPAADAAAVSQAPTNGTVEQQA